MKDTLILIGFYLLMATPLILLAILLGFFLPSTLCGITHSCLINSSWYTDIGKDCGYSC